MEFHDVVLKRRAVRRFEEGRVEPEVIERIARLAQRTSSAGFSQGQRLIVVTDEDFARWDRWTEDGPAVHSVT